jgi:hypothetical protein
MRPTLDGFSFRGTGLGGDEAGSEDHDDEGQSDEKIVHCVTPVSGAFTAALLTLLESRQLQNPTIPLPLCFPGQQWDAGLLPSGEIEAKTSARIATDKSTDCHGFKDKND